MKGGNSPGEKGHPVWHGARHRRRASAGSALLRDEFADLERQAAADRTNVDA
jgi:hypothetical protein